MLLWLRYQLEASAARWPGDVFFVGADATHFCLHENIILLVISSLEFVQVSDFFAYWYAKDKIMCMCFFLNNFLCILFLTCFTFSLSLQKKSFRLSLQASTLHHHTLNNWRSFLLLAVLSLVQNTDDAHAPLMTSSHFNYLHFVDFGRLKRWPNWFPHFLFVINKLTVLSNDIYFE